MKILCICAEGNSRSVGTRFILNQLGNFDVLACGINRNKPETVNILCEWADKILLAEKIMIYQLPDNKEIRDKVIKEFEIGGDRWANPLHPDLHKFVREALKKVGFPVY